MAVRFQGRTLIIDGRHLKLEQWIERAIEFEDRVLVLFDDERYPDGDPRAVRNVVAVDKNGEILWRIRNSSKLFPDVDDVETPYTGLELEFQDGKRVVVAFEPIGMCYEVNIDDGTLSNPLPCK